MREKQQTENRGAEKRQADWEQAESHRKPGERPADAALGRPGSTAPRPESVHDTARRIRQGEVPPGVTRDKLHDPGRQTPEAPPTDNRS
ncbi:MULTISPECIES: hypothetical protein [Ralstonia]|uniref:Uncharacterized protein n=1 Tax=Ralstonia mannitolilytica TaxID=105219 RepID=A0AAJ4ZQY0_9RALS|nr:MULTISPECIES: hypothetical protein [Ralstonia]AJW46771.1 hypothetical protein TK49_18735 [Ralstonia mannitolilytica]MBU9577054.1 hypothetical protein [Ralstonia mannitolilytica]PLT17788.1 hypothetical protein CXP34_14390 [Ralstonia mannitolilytica]QIF10119.1 hypothetical protein G5A69_21870 [Ralstonia mannitolilytica]CAG2131339.1 hypothetical protein LMG6866_00673 [Ralstonia mannitolilytica]